MKIIIGESKEIAAYELALKGGEGQAYEEWTSKKICTVKGVAIDLDQMVRGLEGHQKCGQYQSRASATPHAEPDDKR